MKLRAKNCIVHFRFIFTCEITFRQLFVCVQLKIQLKFIYIYLASFYIDFLDFFTRKTFNGILSFLKYTKNDLETILWYTIIYIFSEVFSEKIKKKLLIVLILGHDCIVGVCFQCLEIVGYIGTGYIWAWEYIIDILGLRILLDRTSENRLIGISIILCFMVSTSIERHPSL